MWGRKQVSAEYMQYTVATDQKMPELRTSILRVAGVKDVQITGLLPASRTLDVFLKKGLSDAQIAVCGLEIQGKIRWHVSRYGASVRR